MAVRGHQQGKFYSEFSNESAEDLKAHFNGIPEIIFLNDVEGMA